MGNHYRLLTGVAALVVCLALVGCGDTHKQPPAQPDTATNPPPASVEATGPGTLEIACVPPAEVQIDGKAFGTTPISIEIDAGDHQVILRRDKFDPYETTAKVASGKTTTVDGSLAAADGDDPAVIDVLLASTYEDVEPWAKLTPHRGAGDDETVLLWPKKNVRKEGLTSFCIEVSPEYELDGQLEFKRGRKSIFKQPFEPEMITTVGEIPQEVLDAIKVGDTVTWGITFDKKSRNVTTTFKLVKDTKVAKKLAKLEKSKQYMRQPPLTQELMRAAVLENYRLYSESLVTHLDIARRFPQTGQPYQRIVSSLRRLDGKDSSLWVTASQNVGGGGRGRAGLARAGRLSGGNIGVPNTAMGPSVPVLDYTPPVVTNTARKMLGVVKPHQEGIHGAQPEGAVAAQPTTERDPATSTPGLLDPTLRHRYEDALREARDAQGKVDLYQAEANQAGEGLAQAQQLLDEAKSIRNEADDAVAAAQDKYQEVLANGGDTTEALDELANAKGNLNAANEQMAHAEAGYAQASDKAAEANAALAAAEKNAVSFKTEVDDISRQIAEAGGVPGLPGDPNQPVTDTTVKKEPVIGTIPADPQQREVLTQTLADARTGFQDAQAALFAADAAVAASAAANGGSPDQALVDEANNARLEFEQAEQNQQEAIRLYIEGTGEVPGPDEVGVPADPDDPLVNPDPGIVVVDPFHTEKIKAAREILGDRQGALSQAQADLAKARQLGNDQALINTLESKVEQLEGQVTDAQANVDQAEAEATDSVPAK